MSAYVVPLVGALICLGTIGELLRRRQLREKYAVLWLLVGTALVMLILFPGLLERLSRTFGVLVPSNLLFFGAIVLLLSVSVHQTIVVPNQNELPDGGEHSGGALPV